MNTNSFKCEKCEEQAEEEYWLDDVKICESCYERATEETDLVIQGLEMPEELLVCEEESRNFRERGIEL